MAYLDESPSNFQQNKEYLMTGDTRPAPGMDQQQRQRDASNAPRLQDFGGGVSTGAGGATGTIQSAPEMDMRTTSAPQSTTTTEEKKPDGTIKTTTQEQKPVFKTTGSLMQRLTNPVSEGAQQGQEQLQQASQAFKELAGPSRTFESVGGAGTLNQAVESGTGMEDARALANAQYGGPQGLANTDVANLQNLYTDISNRASALGTGGGLATMIQQSVPGLTRGQAEYEAKRRLADSKVAGRDLRFEQVNPLRAAIESETEGAEEFAGQRTAEEDAIREASRGLLTGRQDVISEDIQSAIDKALKQQEGAQTAYANISDQGTLDAIRAASPYLQSGTTEAPGEMIGKDVAEALYSPQARQTAEGEALKQAILNDPRYASVAQYDPLELGITKRGTELYDIGGEDYRKVVPDKTTRSLLYERQKELEKAFSPKTKALGEYGTTNPLYYGDNYESLDTRNYMGFDPGTSPSRENVSSDVQKTQYNRISDLMGSLDSIGEAEPFRAAKIYAEVGKYLDDEEKNLEAKGEKLSEQDKEWRQMVKGARKKYKKAKSKPYAQIGGIIATVLVPGGKGEGEQIGAAAYQ
jgi:hypothetical protein